MRSSRDTWETIYNRFDPELQAIQPEWRADREHSPAVEIVREIGRTYAKAPPHVLLSGTMGTGKTTELLRVAEIRAKQGDEFVVYLDLLQHFNKVVGDMEALQHVRSWEVCFLVALALIRAAKDNLGYDAKPEHLSDLKSAWVAAAKATEPGGGAPDVELSALAKSMVLMASHAFPGGGVAAMGLEMVAEVIGATKWTLPIGRRTSSRLPDQDCVMQNLLSAVNVLIGAFQQWNRRVLFVIDGLDRIREFDHARSLFFESEMIGRLACPTVVAAPFALRYHMATSTVRAFTKVCTLVNEPVLKHSDPSVQGSGVCFFCDLYRKRVADLDAGEVISDSLLKRLAFYSGGGARDFVKSIGMLAARVLDADVQTANDDLVEDVLKEARLLVETGLDQGHISLLEKIMLDPKHRLPADDLARELLNYGRLLSYPNDSEWYYPHPLLTLHLVQPAKAGSTG